MDRFTETWKGVPVEYDRVGSSWAYRFVIHYGEACFVRSNTAQFLVGRGLADIRNSVHQSIDSELGEGIANRPKILEDGTYEETSK